MGTTTHTAEYGVVTETAYGDSKDEEPMIRRLYSERELGNLIVPAMKREQIVAKFGHPFIVTTKPDGSEVLEFRMDPRLTPKGVRSQLVGFDVMMKDGVVVEWKPSMYYGTGP